VYDNTVNGMEDTVKKPAVLEKKVTQVFINSKNTVSVLDVNELEGYLGSSFHSIFITTSRTETAVTSERNKFEITTVRAAIHGTTQRKITVVDHFLNAFQFAFTQMKSISDFVKTIIENFL